MPSPRRRPIAAASRLFGPAFAVEYAQLWSPFARRIAPGVVQLLRRGGVATGTVIDLGCGPGTLAAHLGAHGYDVIGIDRSRPMLRLARLTAPAARFRVADLRHVRLPAADAVVSTFDTLNYLNRARDLQRLFHRVARALSPGGVFIFDLLVPAELRVNPAEEDLAYRSTGAIVVVHIERRRRTGRIRHTIGTLPRLAAGARRHTEVHDQRVFAPGPVGKWLRAAAFEATRLPGYPGLPAHPGRVVFLAVRR
jgi:SAM-dependent methyltransferase